MGFVRTIGRWTMTALVINCIIGAGIFGLPGELTALLGRASPLAMIFATLGMAVIMACVAEVASQFSEPGGSYLYVRTAFGRFLGIQTGWFDLLSVISAMAAVSSVFVAYLAIFVPGWEKSWKRGLLLAIVIAIPTVANYRGVRTGATLSNIMTIAKLSPLVLLALFGTVRFAHQPQMMRTSEITSPGLANWVSALVLLVFAFGGWESGLAPTGEFREPRRTIPFGLGAGLVACAAIYVMLQFITVATIGTRATDRPLSETASVLLGAQGATFVTIAVLISTYGWISAALLYGPRLAYSLAAQGDFPSMFARLHPRFQTPAVAILFYAFTAWILGASSTFLRMAMLGSGCIIVLYAGMCGSLIRLRRLRPNADALRIPCGPVLSIFAVAISLWLLTGLKTTELLFMGATALIAVVNWLWVRHRRWQLEANVNSAADPLSSR